MKKIKILQFPISNSYGGITHYALNNWKFMDKSRFECDFATMSKKLDFADDILRTGSKIHYISCYAEDNKEQFIREFNSILDVGYDVVHLHTTYWKSFFAEELCLKHGVKKIIVHAHTTQCYGKDSEERAANTRRHLKTRSLLDETFATDFWACSQEAADWLFDDRVSRSKIRIMNNAIETDRFLYDERTRNQLRKQFGVGEKFIVGHVGRLSYAKNQAFLIEAFSIACKTRDDLVLLIVGDGELRYELEQTVESCGVRDKVLFLGNRNDVNDLYQMMDMFVLPSRYEGNPIVAIEAQAAGLKCLLSDAITRESNVTENVTFLPLEKQTWADALCGASVIVRKNMKSLFKKNGWDIASQLKLIENEYLTVENTVHSVRG